MEVNHTELYYSLISRKGCVKNAEFPTTNKIDTCGSCV